MAAPIYDEHGAVVLILTLFGVSSELTADALASHGRRVVSTAEAITRDIGGRHPVCQVLTGGKEARGVA